MSINVNKKGAFIDPNIISITNYNSNVNTL